MTQPDCGEDWAGCLGIPELPAPPNPQTLEVHDQRPAAIFIIALLVAVLIFDIWALRRKRTRTVSQTTQDWVKKFGVWVTAAILSLLTLLAVHLVWGF